MQLKIDSLSFGYDQMPLFQKQSCSLSGPGLVALFGPNGGGKTTLMKLLAALIPTQKGSILFNGKPPEALYPYIGWVPQFFDADPLFPISVYEIIQGGLLATPLEKNEEQKRIHHVLKQLNLLSYKTTDFAALSGGMKMRALVARALVSRPKILFLDEATAHMDNDSKNHLFKLLTELKNEILIFMVTHELETAQNFADSLLYINREIVVMEKKEVCRHFTQGLYHPPLKGESK